MHLRIVQGLGPFRNWTVKMCQIVNNSAEDCSILPKFGTEFDHVTLDELQMSKSRGQRSRSQCEVTMAKIYYTISNAAADCPILIRLPYNHVTPYIPQTFKVKGQKSRSQHDVKVQKLATLQMPIFYLFFVECYFMKK